ncbi:hypothetical protein [Pseudomonas benzenivorans]|uniref:Uncharacterized protein n=1 Tax=Pseudomonas benzenivorans TaxID=556533 RepID=A0ABY5H990_9PSED|nr:hypothetical protein [Pseudomonas benzenivorans]UTW08911.1 hypothetical protein KDW96_06265 [Pseudomonas benzenivorans]
MRQPATAMQRVWADPKSFEPLPCNRRLLRGLAVHFGPGFHGRQGVVVGSSDFLRQTECGFCKLEQMLLPGGSSRDDVTKVTLSITDMRYFLKVVTLQ